MKRTIEQDWLIKYEHDELGEPETTAVVHARIPGSSFHLEIARIEAIPMEPNPDDDDELGVVRDGEDSDRLEAACLIAHAPDMLKSIRSAIQALEKITGLNGPDELCATWVCDVDGPTDRAWQRVCDVQNELERMADRAVDLENI